MPDHGPRLTESSPTLTTEETLLKPTESGKNSRENTDEDKDKSTLLIQPATVTHIVLPLLEEKTDNPCPCQCCGTLLTASKILAVTNLIFVVLDIIDKIILISHLIETKSADSPVEISWMEFLESISNFEHECFVGNDGFCITMKILMLLVAFLMELPVACLFVYTIFYIPTIGHRVRFVTWYMYVNRYPVIMILFLLETLVYFARKEDARCWSWMNLLMWFLIVIANSIWYYFNQAFARGYLKALDRTIAEVEQVQAGLVEDGEGGESGDGGGGDRKTLDDVVLVDTRSELRRLQKKQEKSKKKRKKNKMTMSPSLD